MQNQIKIDQIRRDYGRAHLSEEDIGHNPIIIFEAWLKHAIDQKVEEPTAMCLSTSDDQGNTDSRIVLLKELNEEGFVWFTNYHSAKGRQLQKNSHASLLFFWPQLEQQIRIRGRVRKTDLIKNQQYFQSRPINSQLSALISPQSQIIKSRQELEKKYLEAQKEHEQAAIKCPENWGGYILKPESIEFWQGRASRLHDRILFSRQMPEGWQKVRLAP